MSDTHSAAPERQADARQFGHMEVAPESIPIWYWHRQVLLKLRGAVSDLLRSAGVGPGSQVLELGCGNRPYERLVLRRGARYWGADLAGNPHADLRIAVDGRADAADASYDAVLSIQVLEHVPDPTAYLAEARRLLRPGGRLILSTHGIWVYHPCPTDYWRWTGAGLKKLLQDQGFKVLEFRGLIGLLPAGVQLTQDSLRRQLPAPLARFFSMLMQVLVALLDRLHRDSGRAHNAMVYILLAEPQPPGAHGTEA